MRKIGIGLLGLGTVGSGVVKALSANQSSITAKLGAELEIKKILVRDLQKERAVRVDHELMTTDFGEIVRDPVVSIVVDAMGGIEPAKNYILQAIAQGKHVVTANKEVIAKYGREILASAEQRGVEVYFEASVGGGIPIIRPLKQCLAANEIQEIMGIINGTTNYILTKMATEGRDFDAILAEAQAKGYAEPDPTNDIEGYDAAYKLVILTALAFGTPVSFSDIKFEGISKITREDIFWARKLGCVIKLLAVAKEQAEGLEVRVSPCLLPEAHPLAKVNDVFNGIFIRGNLVGELLFTGRGAGDLPTASAVVADIVDVAKNILANRSARPACTCYRHKQVLPVAKVTGSFYLRLNLAKGDTLLTVNNLLNHWQVPFRVAAKKLYAGKGGQVVYVIDEVVETKVLKAASKLADLPGVRDLSLLRLEGRQSTEGLAVRV